MKKSDWKHWSLRTQLLSITSVLLILSLIATGMGTIFILKNSLINRVDAELNSTSRTLVNQIIIDYRNHTDNTVRTLPSNYAILVFDSTNEFKRYYVSGVDTADYPDPVSLREDALSEMRGQMFTMPGAAKGSWGWRATIVQIPGSSNTYLVAQKLDGVQALTNQSTVALFSVSSLVVLLAVFLAYLLITHSFKPLKEIEKTASEIAAGDFSERLEIENPTNEIGKLSNSLNKMLNNIEHSFIARKKSEETMRQFVANAGHELRTPLTTISGFSEMYRKGWIEKKKDIDSAMDRIENESDRMKDLVEDLLVLARLDEKHALKKEKVDLRDIAFDAMTDSRANARSRTLRVISLDGGAPKSTPVWGEDTRLRQVVFNLLTNAYRYTPDDTPVEIAVGTDLSEKPGKAIIKICDHGSGIPDTEKNKIFERFYRSDISRARHQGGNGLGLAIVTAIVQAHKGKVDILDTEGGGATFRVTLPLYRAKAAPKNISTLHNSQSELHT